jgi:hypothetical protein
MSMAANHTTVPADQLQTILAGYKAAGYVVTPLPDGRYHAMGWLSEKVPDSIYISVSERA